MKEKATKVFPFRVAKRNDVNWKTKLLSISLTIGTALLLSIFFLWVVSMKDPFPAIKYIFMGTFENKIKFWSFVKELVLLLGIGLALVPAYKMKFWNIGAQGQVLIGALVTSLCMLKLPENIPSYGVILISFFLSMIGGGIWAYIPSIFKAKWNTNETLFTLMMNYIAIAIVTFFVDRWRGSKSALGTINPSTKRGWVDFKTGVNSIDSFVTNYLNSRVIIPLLVVLFLTFFIYFYIKMKKHGYEIRVVGDSISTARYTGINVGHVIRRTMFLSGAICGLMGFFYVACFDHTISQATSGGYGFTAVIVCWLSNFNPFVMIGYSSLIVFLDKGARNLSNVSYASTLNEYSTELILFIIIIAIMLATFFLRYHIVRSTPVNYDKRYKKILTKGLLEKEVYHG